MRKAYLIILMIFLVLPLSAEDDISTMVVYDAPSTRVEFTVGLTHNIGFSSRDFSGSTIKPSEEYEITGDTIAFDNISEDFMSYTTDIFYFYLQVFTTEPVKAVIGSHPALSSTGASSVHYTNLGYSGYSGSAMTTEAVLVDETGVDTTIPRPYFRALQFSVPVSSVTGNNKYTSSLMVTVSSIN